MTLPTGTEIIVIAAVVIIFMFLAPKKLPSFARSVREFIDIVKGQEKEKEGD